jgi:hypothetical protein
MSREVLDLGIVDGPVDVPLGRRIVSAKREYYPFPRQRFPIDLTLLLQNGYGDAAISRLERGYTITYGDFPLTGPGRGILEFPDGTRYMTSLEFLGGEQVAITIIQRLPDAIR